MPVQMSRFARKVDTTHAPIGAALRKVGAIVYDTSRLGDDFADYVVLYGGVTVLIECKTPNRKGGGRKALPREEAQLVAQMLWTDAGGKWIIATSPEDAVKKVRIHASQRT